MEFGWSEADTDLYRRVLEFSRARLNDDVAAREREHRFDRTAWSRLGEFGIAGLCVPERWRGLGLSTLSTALAIEALGRGCEDMGLVFSASAHLFACVMPILHHGGDALRDRLLPGLATGKLIGANAITEAEAGSDAYALTTKAELVEEDGSYLLTGTKTYVTNAPVADVFVVYATSKPGDGYLGVSAFVVERSMPGLTIGQPFTKAGLTTSPIAAIYLDRVRVPAGNRLGRQGGGAAVFAGSMQWERACLFASYVGAMDRQLDQAITHATSRRQFRKPIGKHQAVAHRIADMKLRLEAARLLLYRACWLNDQPGVDPTLEVSLAKLAVSEAAIQSSLDSIQLHGGLGYMVESGIERSLRDALPATIFSGTSEIQRDLVAGRLGL
jgi:alkylation response protein AidB-like acyl-CoA dehydrogenase